MWEKEQAKGEAVLSLFFHKKIYLWFIIVLQIIDSSFAAIHGIMNCIDTGIKFSSEETYEWICHT